MRYTEVRPAADLAPYIHCLWELEGGSATLAEPIFPDGRVELVCHLADRPTRSGDDAAQPHVMIVGQMTSAVRLEPVSRLHAVGVRFTPAGARAWLAPPLHELTARFEDADAVMGITARRVRAAVDTATTSVERFARLQSVLRAHMIVRRVDPATIVATRTIAAHRGCVTVDRVALESGLSARQLERRFLETVGLTPKAFALTVRFQSALTLLQAGIAPAAAAADAGYADQSHLAREFRRFAGVPARDVDLARVAFVQDTPAPHPANC